LVLGSSFHAPQDKAILNVLNAQVEAYRPLTLTVCEQRFRVESPQFYFRPGQYMIFHMPEINKIVRRSYSICSSPSDTSRFEICVRAVSGGYCSNYVHRLRPGDLIQVEGPYGEFSLEPESNREVILVATGTGISPIKSMLLQLFERKTPRRIRLFFGLRNVSDLFYGDLFDFFAAKHPNFEPVITLSQPDPEAWSGPRGRVTRLIQQQVTRVDAERSEAYLCGGRQMIEDVKRLLIEKGLEPEHIQHENFY
jgi:ferredoxin-NADP reductase